jgi:hypothetical protein
METKVTAESIAQAYPEIHAEILKKGHEAGHAEGFKAGREEGLAAGAEAERERIRGVEQISIPGHDALITQLKFDGKTTKGEAAEKVLEAEAALRRTKAESFVAETVKPVPAAVVTADAEKPEIQDDNLPVEEKCEARWNRDPKIRDDFKMGGFAAYLAYERNQQNVRIWEKKAD